MSALLPAVAQLTISLLAVTAAFLIGALWQARRVNTWKTRAEQLRAERQRLRATGALRSVAPDHDPELEAAERRARLRERLRVVEQRYPAVHS